MSYQLILGDTVEKMKELEDESVDLVVTSPPYPGVQKMWGELFSSENFEKAHAWLDLAWNECVRVLKPGCKLCINIANTGRSPYLDNAGRVGMWAHAHSQVQPKGHIIWFKGEGSVQQASWGTFCNAANPLLIDQHEYILVFKKTGDRYAPTREHTIERDDFLKWRNSIWTIKAESATSVGHIAPFPLEIPKRLITLYSFDGETVLDPFVGSGTTIIAAKMLNRNGIGIDHSQEYIELAADRINKAMASLGKEPRRFRNGVVAPLLFTMP